MSITLDLNKSSGVLDLTKAAPSFKTIRGVLNWEPHPVHGASLTAGFDLDIFAFILNGSSKITSGSDVVFFNNKSYGGGVVSVPVDNRTGEGADDEYIDMQLNNLPASAEKVDVYVFIHEAAARGQTFGMLANSHFVLNDVENNKELVRYTLSQYTNETAIHIGRFEKTPSGWTFLPTGDVANADPNLVIQAYL